MVLVQPTIPNHGNTREKENLLVAIFTLLLSTSEVGGNATIGNKETH